MTCTDTAVHSSYSIMCELTTLHRFSGSGKWDIGMLQCDYLSTAVMQSHSDHMSGLYVSVIFQESQLCDS
jgi:hypothetical protein